MISLDSYVTLGRSGLRISPLSLGAMAFGEDHGWGASPEVSAEIIAEYLDRDGNSIDTANLYTNGHSEKIVGDFFAKSGVRRDKCRHRHQVLLQHVRRRPERRRCRPQGDGAAGRGVPAPAAEYSLLERTVEGELTPMAQEMGIGVMPWSPLKSGYLSGRYRRDNVGSVDSARTRVGGGPSEADFVVIDALLKVAEGDRRVTGGRRPGLGTGPPWRLLDHHRAPAGGPSDRQPRRARRDAERRPDRRPG